MSTISFLEPAMMLQMIRTEFLNLEKCDKAFPIIFLFGKIQGFHSADEGLQRGGTWSIPVLTLRQAEGTNATILVPASWVKHLSKLTPPRTISFGHEQILLWATCPLLPRAPSWSIINNSYTVCRWWQAQSGQVSLWVALNSRDFMAMKDLN